MTSLALLGSKVGHQIVSLAFPHCLVMPYWHYQLVLSLHQPESGQLSFNNVSQSRTPGISGSDKDIDNNTKHTDKILNGKIDTQSATSRHFCLFSAYVGVFSSDFFYGTRIFAVISAAKMVDLVWSAFRKYLV